MPELEDQPAQVSQSRLERATLRLRCAVLPYELSLPASSSCRSLVYYGDKPTLLSNLILSFKTNFRNQPHQASSDQAFVHHATRTRFFWLHAGYGVLLHFSCRFILPSSFSVLCTRVGSSELYFLFQRLRLSTILCCPRTK
jgi:hypothetical protein